ncbi:DUF3180 domain-containing protein [Corynebacterium pseudotuberculosis]|uniref:DUF3180 family protein n=2 Tax=Corynebacterium pseudotuberculosis TaxID=1719 RepID=D9QCF9_CORP2|nr:DUF3180 domain-containing protein [Corynebacterium pseudotuberculosis]AER69797.1 Hypothetical protein Cp106_1746 [Corynebacterium pseudotuberculosis 1/06-A]ADK29580.1 DUF3180 family protein [Corynebacterium pseudotuberculosis FRC41]ADL11235.1 DUF3180 family protein [Corynebacterium pseudotuberculosis C231]ADL21654.1 DUF3180 domain-containing protein [Corynebacterium pseudotuberculosis 1002]ADO27046.1 DUF3180 family protein [Corynebacterium pseudotuberculosis I19]
MKQTSILGLVGVFLFCVIASFILVMRFYGVMSSVPFGVALCLWGMTALCVLLAVRVRSRIKNDQIGQDRSQLNPVTAAQFLVIGKASAWTGAIFGGGYVGLGIFVLTSRISAQDLPIVIASALGGVAMSAAGYWLERSCTVPPTDAVR